VGGRGFPLQPGGGRSLQKTGFAIMTPGFWRLARRERGAYPTRSVTSEQRRQPPKSVLRKSVAVRSEDFWVLARLRRRSMPTVACDRGETKPKPKRTAPSRTATVFLKPLCKTKSECKGYFLTTPLASCSQLQQIAAGMGVEEVPWTLAIPAVSCNHWHRIAHFVHFASFRGYLLQPVAASCSELCRIGLSAFLHLSLQPCLSA
jgi:hypothetical protein